MFFRVCRCFFRGFREKKKLYVVPFIQEMVRNDKSRGTPRINLLSFRPSMDVRVFIVVSVECGCGLLAPGFFAFLLRHI